MNKKETESVITTLSETSNFIAWQAEEPDGEITYHVELGTVTLHFYKEEWDEFMSLVKLLKK
jgi:hypothetical protein